jgi:glucose/arabinose dehydrogenase/cytochrome c553
MWQCSPALFMTALLFVGSFSHSASAADTAFECRWTDSELKLDGIADEPAWQTAQTIDRFYLPWLKDNRSRPPRSTTKARLLWDRDHLYFFAEMQDTDLYADVTEHDGRTWTNDVFELFFKPADNRPGYYEFQVNAAGTQMDMFLPQRRAGGFQRFIGDGEFHIEAKVKLDGTLNRWQDRDTGWSVEGRIPWTDMIRTGGPPAPGEAWKFALCRYDYSIDFEGPDLSTCAPLNSRDFHHYEDYASLTFVGPKVKRSIHGLKPYATTSRVVGSPEPPLPYRVERVLPDLKISQPVSVTAEPGSSRLLFITPKGLYRTTEDPASGEFETLLELKSAAYSIAFHPDFADNGFMYLGHNGVIEGKEKNADGKDTKWCQITRYTIEREPPCRLDPDSRLQIMEWESNGHNGAAVAFGLDGMLYVTSGDGTSDSDTNLTGQRTDLMLAKVLRIDVDHPAPGKTYSVPKDNPFVGQPDFRPETWAYGFRNPWRMTVDPTNGNLWVGNNGQDLWEQVYLIKRGANYGWSVYEGGHIFYAERKLGPTPVSKPIFDHPHSESRSLTGGIVYFGSKLPELHGAYLYGDHSTGKIWAAMHDGKKLLWHCEIADSTLAITDFGLDGDGELLIADYQDKEKGGFYTLVPTVAKQPDHPFPTRLSDSGLFASVAEHRMVDGVIPYSVNAPLWSDGSIKHRYMAVPPTTDSSGKQVPTQFSLGGNGPWNLPEHTVLVKSFALEMEEGNPDSRRWIETRFLTKQQNEWIGYSYIWNNEQTDAVLVAQDGLDCAFQIQTDSGPRTHKWRYPSRAECMVCHSRAARYVLGVTSPQLNRQHEYADGIVDDQLAVFTRLGLLKRGNWMADATGYLQRQLEDKGVSAEAAKKQVAEITATRNQRTAPDNELLVSLNPKHLPRLADPYDESEDLAKRARSYLHANCAQCHVPAGGGNAQFDIVFHKTLDKTKLIDTQPLHNKYGVVDPRLIAPGEPDRSILLHRIAHRGRGQMPQLATTLVDERAVAMIRRWIAEMKPVNATKK